MRKSRGTEKRPAKRDKATPANLGRNPRGAGDGVQTLPSKRGKALPERNQLIERVLERENMKRALARVKKNQGAPGVDGMTVEDLEAYLKRHWPRIKVELLQGRYRPRPVKRVYIPKPNGGRRPLGIPTVLDRLIQQALHQVLSPIFEPDFSESSYGFRPERNAHQAILKAKAHQEEGKKWVVDIDLENFFDEVNQDILMARVARKVKDKQVRKLIRRYLQSGILEGGVYTTNRKGTPQGGPLSPLLSNILLDDLDKELEKRGHAFCRYADDCNIYVRREKAGQRVFRSIKKFLERKLKLRVHPEKSKVSRTHQRKFLGYGFLWTQKGPKIRVARESLQDFRVKLKGLFRKGRGRNLERFIREDLNPVLRGWIQYFSLAEFPTFAWKLDGWIRRRLRLIVWRQWKNPWTRRKRLMEAGLSEERAVRSAFNRRGPWWNSGRSRMNQACPKKYFEKMNLVSVLEEIGRLRSLCLGNRLGT